MTLTAQEAWTRLLDRARQEMPEQTFRTWTAPTEPLKIEGEKLFVGAPDRFAAEREGNGSAASEATPDIAVQVYNRAIHNQMMARIKEGQSIKQVIAWAKDELEGFTR